MLSFKSIRSHAAALVLSATVIACSGAENGNEATAAPEEDKASPSQVIAVVNGQEVTIHELNTELARIPIPEGADIQAIKNNALQALVTRKLFEQEAVKGGLDREPRNLLEIKRAKSSILAKAYLRSKAPERPTPTRAEAEDFVFENPSVFAERTFYIFDSIVISSNQLSEDQKDDFEALADMDEIEKKLAEMGIQALRRPFSAYSEALPTAMREQLPTLVRDKTVFFIVQGKTETITRYQKSRPAALTGTKAIDAATTLLTRRSSKEYLANLKAQVLLTSEIEYLGEFAGLEAQVGDEVDEKIQEEIQESVTSVEETDTDN